MSERRNDLEIRNESPQIALQIPNSDRSPLYDVRYHARRCPSGQRVRSDVSRTIYFGSVTGPSSLFRATTWQPSLRSGSPSRSWHQPAKAGGARRDRTDDLMLAKHALSQLSYGPVPEDECFLSRAPCSPAFASAKAQQPSFKRACRAEAAEQRRLVGLGRLELPTSRLSSARSNQLSYKP